MLGHSNETADAILEQKLADRMAKVKTKILVLSGKGGVGKSMVAANLAAALDKAGLKIGLLDVDLHGPSIPGMLGVEHEGLDQDDDYDVIPLTTCRDLKVVSVGMMLRSDDVPVIWRGPKKFKAIRQLLRDVVWGELDVLVIDAPPGTGDESVAVGKLAGDDTRALIVTTSQRAALADVKRCIRFCKNSTMSVAGVVENMSGYVCPECGALLDIFPAGGGKLLAEEAGVPFLGSLPVDPVAAHCGEEGRPFILAHPDCPASKGLVKIVENLALCESPAK